MYFYGLPAELPTGSGVIALRGIDTTSYSSGRTSSVATVSNIGPVDGDILIAILFTGAVSGGTTTPVAPAGWTQIGTPGSEPNNTDNSFFTGRFYAYWKRASGESGTYTWTYSTGSSQLLVAAYSGCIASGSPIDAFSSNGGQNSTTTTALSVTTTVATDLLLYAAFDWTGSGTLTPPTGFTERFDALVYLADKALTSAGATGNVTQTNADLNTSDGWGAYLIALLPAAGGGPVTNPLTLTISCATALSKINRAGKALSIASVTSVVNVRRAGKALAAACASAVTSTALKARLLSLSIGCSTSVSKALSAGKLLSIASTTTTTMTSLKARVLTLLISCATGTSKLLSVGKRLTIASTTATVATAIKVKIVTLLISCATGVSRAVSVGKRLAVTCASAVTSSKSVGKKLAVTCASAVASLKTIGKRLSIASITSLIASAIKPSGTTYHVTVSIAVRTALASIDPLKAWVATALRIVGRANKATIIAASAPVEIVGVASMGMITGSANMTVHDPIDFFCGDSWRLTGPLQDANGAALNLTGATITWRLDSVDGTINKLIRDNAGNGGVSVVDLTTATILVNVSPTVTTPLIAGTYRDFLHVRLADGTELTEWTGIIRAGAKPA